MKHVRFAKTGYIITSVVMFIMGMLLLIVPELSVIVLCRAIGIVVILAGASKINGYFSNDLYRLAFQYDFALGTLTVLFGGLMLIVPEVFAGFLAIAVAVYVIINAVFTLQTAVEAKRFGISKWWILLVVAGLAGLFGLLTIVKPFDGMAAVMRLLGLALMTDGLQNAIVAVLTVHSRNANNQIIDDDKQQK